MVSESLWQFIWFVSIPGTSGGIYLNPNHWFMPAFTKRTYKRYNDHAAQHGEI
jgi:hypothetical protein